MIRVIQHSEPLQAVFPGGRTVYFSNISEVLKKFGLTGREIRDLLASGEAYHVKQTMYGRKPSKRLLAEGARFEYIINQ